MGLTRRSPRRGSKLAVAVLLTSLSLTACGGGARSDSAPIQVDDALGSPPAGVYFATAPAETIAVVDRPTTVALPTPTLIVSSLDSDGDGWFIYDELVIAVNDESAKTEWPANYQLDPATLLDYPPAILAQNPHYQVGLHRVMVLGAYTCAWSLTWLDAYAAGDAALMSESNPRIRAAIQEILAADPAGAAFFLEMLDRATLGDVADFQQVVIPNYCASPGWLPKPTAGPAGWAPMRLES